MRIKTTEIENILNAVYATEILMSLLLVFSMDINLGHMI